MKFKITTFDGEKIYHGRKSGLKLYGTKSPDSEDLLIFSLGEYQPGRIQIYFEGYLQK